jgi:hypothetical protein
MATDDDLIGESLAPWGKESEDLGEGVLEKDRARLITGESPTDCRPDIEFESASTGTSGEATPTQAGTLRTLETNSLRGLRDESGETRGSES